VDAHGRGVDDSEAGDGDVGALVYLEEAAPAPPPLGLNVGTVEGNVLAGVGGIGDVLAVLARVLGDDPFSVDALPNVDRVASDECPGGLLHGAPGQVEGPRVTIVSVG